MHSKSIRKQEFGELLALSTTRTTIAIFIDVAAIAGLLVLAAWSQRAVTVGLVIILIARQQHALAILIHEGIHGRLYPSRRLNDLAVRWLLSGPLLVSYEGYRRTHLRHHAHTMTVHDPDYQFVKDFPISAGQFAVSVMRDLTGVSYVSLLLYYWHNGWKESRSIRRFLGSLVPPIVVNLALFVALWLNGFAWLYFVCWLAPLLFVLPFLLHLRGICEHGGLEPHTDPMYCTWTVVNPLQAFFVAPHNINYHMEHHAFPAVPQFNLPKLHRILAANGKLPETNIHRSYWTILKTLIAAQ